MPPLSKRVKGPPDLTHLNAGSTCAFLGERAVTWARNLHVLPKSPSHACCPHPELSRPSALLCCCLHHQCPRSGLSSR